MSQTPRARSAPRSAPRTGNSPRRPTLSAALSAPARFYTNLFSNLTQLTRNRIIGILTESNAIQPSPRVIRNLETLPKPSGRPKLVIKWGPPASGKGSARMREAINSLGDDYSTYLHVNVDAVVESTPYFTRASRTELIRMVGKTATNAQILAFLNKITPAEARKLGKPYANVRNTRNEMHRKISAKQDALIDEALDLGRNVSVETTGSGDREGGWPGWLINKEKVKTDYDVVFVFPLVTFPEAWRRYQRRPLQSFRQGGGFRFASNRTGLRNTYVKSYKNFIGILGNPQQRQKINRIIVLDPYSSNKNINISPGNSTRRYITVARIGKLRAHLAEFVTAEALRNNSNLVRKLMSGGN